MCLAVPARIVSLQGRSALVDLHGNRLTVSVALTPDVKVGDHVLLHAGFAIQRLDPRAAEQTFALLEELQAGSAKPGQSESSSAALGSVGIDEGGTP